MSHALVEQRSTSSPGVHLAIVYADYLAKIISGEKTIEGRFTKTRCAPYKRVLEGDLIFFKEPSGPVVARAVAKEVLTWEIRAVEKAQAIIEEYSIPLCLGDDLAPRVLQSRFATLIHIADVAKIDPVAISKRDHRGWVVLSPQMSFLPTSGWESQLIVLALHVSADCRRGLHSFARSRDPEGKGMPTCRFCGASIAGWDRLYRRDVADLAHTVQQLRREKLRDEMWRKAVDRRALNHALRKGMIGLREAAEKRLWGSIGTVFELGKPHKTPHRDGFQTPFEGSILYYAQHAMACCCRRCVDLWHGIPQGRDLTEEEANYLVELIMFYIRERLPDLSQEGITVPPMRASR